jgi:hypothetical protein
MKQCAETPPNPIKDDILLNPSALLNLSILDKQPF